MAQEHKGQTDEDAGEPALQKTVGERPVSDQDIEQIRKDLAELRADLEDLRARGKKSF